MKLTNSQIEITKYLAIILMVFDHYSNLYLDSFSTFKIMGRLVFPLFAIILVYNYIYNSKNKYKYILRLSIFAIISQPFYYFAFNEYFNDKFILNIFFTLSLGLGIIYLFEKFILNKRTIEKILFWFFILILTLIISIWLSYMIFGPLMIIFLYFTIKNNNKFAMMGTILSIYSLNILWSPLLALIALLSIPLIYFISKVDIEIKRMNKWFFYLFYPVHLIVLKLI